MRSTFVIALSLMITILVGDTLSIAQRRDGRTGSCPDGMIPVTTETCEKAGLLKVITTPSGAAVLVNGKRKGTTPLTVQVRGGTHTVTVRKGNGPRKHKRIKVMPGQTQRVRFQLRKPPIPVAEGPLGVVEVPLSGGAAMKLIRLTGGTFAMGNPTRPRQVKLSGFQLGMYEVTRRQWEAVMGASLMGSKPRPCPDPCSPELPMQNVTWNEAIAFMNALTKQANQHRQGRSAMTPCYEVTNNRVTWITGCTGFRLPTDAEWDYAARAGTKSVYTFDAKVSGPANYIWYEHNAGNRPREVGQMPSNAWGFYDMHGNVWEWCWDWFEADLPTSGATTFENPEGPIAGAERVIRGGSYKTPGTLFQPPRIRRSSKIDLADVAQGLRVARMDIDSNK